MEQWIIAIAATTVICTALCVLLVVLLTDRQYSRRENTDNSGLWCVEMWHIAQGYCVKLEFKNNIILGRGTLYNSIVAGPAAAQVDMTISREQCMFYEQDGGLLVWNLSVVNPTAVNGYRINTPGQLLPGIRLELGNSAFLVTRVDCFT